MKQKLFFAALVLPWLMAGCVKDGDLNALRHPISIQGEFDPTVGVPLAHMEAHMNDFVGLWTTSDNMSTYIDAATGIVAFRYSNTLEVEMDYTSKRAQRSTKGTKASGDTLILDTRTLNGHTDINLFKRIASLDTGELSAKGMYLSIIADLHTTVSDPVLALNDYGVEIYFDSTVFTILFQDGTSEDISIDSMNNINIRELSHGRRISLFENYDASWAVNRKPIGIDYRTVLNIAKIGTTMIPISTLLYIRDSLYIDKVHASLATDVDFPMQLYCNHMAYTDTLSLDLHQLDSLLNIYDVSLQDSGNLLVFEVENGMPLELTLDAYCLDEHMNPLTNDLFTPGLNKIEGAPIKKLTGSTSIDSYVADGKTTTRLLVDVKGDLLQDLRKTRYLRMILGINSASQGAAPGDIKPTISVRGTDELNLRLHGTLATHVSYPFN